MFSRNRPDRDDRATYGRYWSGRGGRAEYWAVLGVLIALNIIFPSLSTSFPAGAMLIFTIRRLHDFGKSGCWSALPFGFGLLCGAGMVAVPLAAGLIQAVALVTGVAFAAFLGFMPGDADANRFGPPPPTFRRKRADLGETFS